MQTTKYRRWLAAAALAIGPVLASHSAYGQYAAQSSGHALDANNQVGSGGFNGASQSTSLVTGNDIVYGNVTGGRGFTGSLRQFDPVRFHGKLSGTGIDNFIAGSNGAPTAYSPNYNLNAPRPFYGASRGVNAPPGSVLIGSTGAAVGTSLAPSNPYAASSISSADQLAGVRVGTTNILGIPGGSTNGLLQLPGGYNSSNPNIESVLAGSPLTGLGAAASSDSAAFDAYLANPTPGQLAPSSIPVNSLNALRRQLDSSSPQNPDATAGSQNLNDGSSTTNGANGPNQPGGSSPVNPFNPSSGNPLLPSATPGGSQIRGTVNGNAPLQMPFNSAANGAGASRLNDSVGNAPLGTFSESPRGVQLVSPATYSSQYAAMRDQLQRYNIKSSTPVTKRTTPAKQQPGAPQAPGTPGKTTPTTPDANPGTPGIPAIPAGTPGAQSPGVAPGIGAVPGGMAPVKIDAIAGTITSKRASGLHDLLAKAEDALKHDQLKPALEQFDAAMIVAPNNQMIALGRANAQLAGGYYGAAEISIRRAIAADATVLMAQLDLTSMLSADRLDHVKKDLKDLAEKNPKESRPWFLLAYIAYNTGDAQTAANDLEEAHKRSVPADAPIHLMQEYWQLPKVDGGQAGPNK